MKQAFMRGVCALNMEAMTMFRGGGGNGVTPANQEDEESDVGQNQEVMGSDVSLDPPPPLPPSHSAPLSHLYGTQTNIPQSRSSHPPPSSQPSHFPPPHTLPIPPPTAVATSSVRMQTSQQSKLNSLSSRGQSTVGVAPRRRGCGLTRPAVMVERHTLG